MLLRWITVAVIIQVASPFQPMPFFGSSIFASPDSHKSYANDNCVCNGNVCDCCLSIDHVTVAPTKVCTHITLGREPRVGLNVNGQSFFSKSVSEFFENAAPICIPAVPGLDVCVKVYGVQVTGLNNRVCVQVSARVLGNDVIGFDFKCLRFSNGLVSFGSVDEAMRFARRVMYQPSYQNNYERDIFSVNK